MNPLWHILLNGESYKIVDNPKEGYDEIERYESEYGLKVEHRVVAPDDYIFVKFAKNRFNMESYEMVLLECGI